jgi:hypothetical protein
VEVLTDHALAPVVTPHGHLILTYSDEALPLEPALAAKLATAFARGGGHGLLQLGAEEVGTALPAELGYWRDFAARYVNAVCTHPELQAPAAGARVAPPPDGELQALAAGAPPMQGAEYLDASLLQSLWKSLDAAFHAELAESGEPVEGFLKRRSPAWNLVGRVHFNLAENRGDDEAPFAFLATYTTHLAANSKARHVPLGQALHEYAGTSSPTATSAAGSSAGAATCARERWSIWSSRQAS